MTPCCMSMHTQSNPWCATTSAENALGIESQAPNVGSPRRHFAFVAFGRIRRTAASSHAAPPGRCISASDGARLEALGRVEDLRQQAEVARRCSGRRPAGRAPSARRGRCRPAPAAARTRCACVCSFSFHGPSVMPLIVCIATSRSRQIASAPRSRPRTAGSASSRSCTGSSTESNGKRSRLRRCIAATVTPCPVTPMKRVRPCVARLDRRLERAAGARAPSPTRPHRRGCAAGAGRPGRVCSRSSECWICVVRLLRTCARRSSWRGRTLAVRWHPRPDAQLRLAVRLAAVSM